MNLKELKFSHNNLFLKFPRLLFTRGAAGVPLLPAGGAAVLPAERRRAGRGGRRASAPRARGPRCAALHRSARRACLAGAAAGAVALTPAGAAPSAATGADGGAAPRGRGRAAAAAAAAGARRAAAHANLDQLPWRRRALADGAADGCWGESLPVPPWTHHTTTECKVSYYFFSICFALTINDSLGLKKNYDSKLERNIIMFKVKVIYPSIDYVFK